MLEIFHEVQGKKKELEQLLILVQTNEIMYRQRNEIHIANQLKHLEQGLRRAVKALEINVEK